MKLVSAPFVWKDDYLQSWGVPTLTPFRVLISMNLVGNHYRTMLIHLARVSKYEEAFVCSYPEHYPHCVPGVPFFSLLTERSCPGNIAKRLQRAHQYAGYLLQMSTWAVGKYPFIMLAPSKPNLSAHWELLFWLRDQSISSLLCLFRSSR